MALRNFVVTRVDARRTVAEFLHRHLGLAWADARLLVKEGKVRVEDQPCRDSTHRLQRGQRLSVEVSEEQTPSPRNRKRQPPDREPEKSPQRGKRPVEEKTGHKPSDRKPDRKPDRSGTASADIVLLYQDEHVVVVDKPAGLTTMRHAHEAEEFGQRGKRFLPETLEDLLPELLPRSQGKPARVIAVHRLDKETSGLVVFARTPEAAKHLGQQLRAHTAERRYLAVVRGAAKDATIESWLVRDRGDGRRGSGLPEEGQRSVTHVHVVESLGAFTLVECRLETGRTHQVRIHLGEQGTPLCGERIYDRPLNGRPLPDGSDAKRIALHAADLGFAHPVTGEKVRWTSRLPRDLHTLIEQLRRKKQD